MDQRLIEVDFPLTQASLDSVHEKSIRQGHISTLHIWPARRPLAASRAAIIATLLPDPGVPAERKHLLDRLGGEVVEVQKVKRLPSGKVEVKVSEETRGGILHWGRELGPGMDWFRDRIKEAYGGQAPRVLDPFSGGGAIPLEAMRLGCEATAIDLNPVAWFILKCTLEYPQQLAGQTRSLPQFARESPPFIESYFKGVGKKKRLGSGVQGTQSQMFDTPPVDLAWHVRAWGWWVLQHAKADLQEYYPVVDGRPSVAYLWARTVKCKGCRATIPLLKTLWLSKKDNKRVLLTMQPNVDKAGVSFGVQSNVPQVGGNAAQRREHDKRISVGTMSRSGAACPCCKSTIMTMEDIRLEGKAGRIGSVMTAVVIDGQQGKEYRLPAEEEIQRAVDADRELERAFAEIPFGLPTEALPSKEALGIRVPLYGFDQWYKLFTSRQLLALATFIKHIRAARIAMHTEGYPPEWIEALQGYLALGLDRLADRSSTLCRPDPTPTQSGVINTFSRFALPITWDFIEGVTIEAFSGGFAGSIEWVAKVVEQTRQFVGSPQPCVVQQSAQAPLAESSFDAVVTDPPYYDAISYSDLMDFFYVWLRRTLHGLSPEIDAAFTNPLSPKWDSAKDDGELIDDASRFGGDKAKSKSTYENGMFRVFQRCCKALKPDGRLVVVFAHKHPDAWETLVSAIIRAGFVVEGSWPIQTEMGNRMRALSSAALSSSVWLVCKKRPSAARPGWDNRVLEDMEANIAIRLRDFWDAGVRGPDFVWAATGPALEAYSKHPIVKKADAANNSVMTVSEFLRQVRRIVVNFVVGRVLSTDGDERDASELDSVTTYYLLHRHDFGMEDAPIGACILYAVSCNLSDRSLADQYDILQRTGGKAVQEDEGDEELAPDDGETPTDDVEEGTGSVVKLKTWQQRSRKGMGYDTDSRSAPLIDQVHRLMHLWKSGDVNKVNDYVDARGLRRNALFTHLLQALIESAAAASEERALLESISNHMAARGIAPVAQPRLLGTK